MLYTFCPLVFKTSIWLETHRKTIGKWWFNRIWWEIWLVVWNMNFMFPYIGDVIIPIDELIFFRGFQTTNQFDGPSFEPLSILCNSNSVSWLWLTVFAQIQGIQRDSWKAQLQTPGLGGTSDLPRVLKHCWGHLDCYPDTGRPVWSYFDTWGVMYPQEITAYNAKSDATYNTPNKRSVRIFRAWQTARFRRTSLGVLQEGQFVGLSGSERMAHCPFFPMSSMILPEHQWTKIQ